MPTYEIEGTYKIIVWADDVDDARIIIDNKLSSVVEEYEIESITD